MNKVSFEVVMNDLKNKHSDFKLFTKELKFDSNSSYHRIIISLYCSILELTENCITLMEKNGWMGIAIIMRSIMEAYVDLKNVTKDNNYCNRLRVNFLKDTIPLQEAMKPKIEEHLKATPDGFNDIDKSIAEMKQEKIDLQNNGYNEIKIKEKFEIAEMSREYRFEYKVLCSDSHNSFLALTSRHLPQNCSDNTVYYYKPIGEDRKIDYITTITEYLNLSTNLVHTKLKSSASNKI